MNRLSNATAENAASPHCVLCGLVCAVAMEQAKHVTQHHRCARLADWQRQYDSAARSGNSLPKRDGERFALPSLSLNARSLIWLEGCDAAATRSAVKLAELVGATVHVGQSPGSHSLKTVMGSSGWLGTTLSEVSAHGDLVITLGDGVLTESPLLAERFLQSSNASRRLRWIHITSQPTVSLLGARQPDEVICVPRLRWFDWLTQVALHLSPLGSNCSPESSSEVQPAATRVAELLVQADYSTWVWDVDEFLFATDELLIRRMLGIAHVLSETKRCSLLPLDMNVGRVTAEETLLWLTGCSPTATFAEGKWRAAERYAHYSLEQWQQSFETVIMISNLPSLRSLPNLRCDLVLQTQPTLNANGLQVAAVGLSTSGHLFRGDRGTVHYVPKGELTSVENHDEAELVASPSELPDLPDVAYVLHQLAAMNSKKVEAPADAY